MKAVYLHVFQMTLDMKLGKKTLEFHADPKDLIIFISSSGESKNMINACKFTLKNISP